MAIFRFFNKYPQTDLHELNADYILAQLASYDSRIENVETAVTSFGERMDAAENGLEALADRVTINEGDIVNLKAADISLDGRLDVVEAWDVRNAEMLRDVTGVSTTAGDVTINFAKDEYTNGAKTAGTDSAVIPAATTSNAGVIIASEKEKLNAFAVDGSGNAVFAGTVGGSAPVSNGDYATKQYVDSLAITGSAGVSEATVNMLSTHGTPTNNSYIRRYGNVRELHLSASMDEITSDIAVGTSTGATVFYADLIASDCPAHKKTFNNVPVYIGNTYYMPGYQVEINTTGRIIVYNRTVPLSIGDDVPIFSLDLTYIVDD